ncbi:MAG: hypothetical protein NVS4B3_04980 [Gemmatimonadaceae bacterium]
MDYAGTERAKRLADAFEGRDIGAPPHGKPNDLDATRLQRGEDVTSGRRVVEQGEHAHVVTRTHLGRREKSYDALDPTHTDRDQRMDDAAVIAHPGDRGKKRTRPGGGTAPAPR